MGAVAPKTNKLDNWSYEVDWKTRTHEVSRDVREKKNFLLIWWVISLVSNPKYSDRRALVYST